LFKCIAKRSASGGFGNRKMSIVHLSFDQTTV
jgi:hypothetical protein